MKRIYSILVFSFVCSFVLSACQGSSKPPHYGVFLKKDSSYVEMVEFKGGPDSRAAEGIPTASDSQPLIAMWYPEVNLNFLIMTPLRGEGQISFDVNPKDDGILEIRPTDPLDDGVYCLIQGNPVLPPNLIAHWCFRVGEAGAGDTSSNVPQSQFEIPQEQQPIGQPTALPIKSPPPVSILPFDYQEKDMGDGWKIAVVRLYFLNVSERPIPFQRLQVTGVSVETLEKKTYPADLIDPTSWYESASLREFLEEDLHQGQYDWSKPKEILAGKARGGSLGIPPHFPFHRVPYTELGAGWWVEYGIGFRFATAAHPVRITLQIPPYEDIQLDLTVAKSSIADPSPAEVNAHPLAELADSFILDNENFKFVWDGTCVFRKRWSYYEELYLPYTLVNKNPLDEQRVVIDFPHAIYVPGGILIYQEESIKLTIGPGQTLHDLYQIEDFSLAFLKESDSLHLYLIHYENKNNLKVYELNCVEVR